MSCPPGDWTRGAPVTVQLACRPAPAPLGPKQLVVSSTGGREEAGWKSLEIKHKLATSLVLRGWQELVTWVPVSASESL